MAGSSNLEVFGRDRFANIRKKAEEMGVLDINFSGEESANSLECYEKALEIIAENKDRFDRNAGEGRS